ncbi:similar to Saccharomyces cerevisiae YOL071W EMI5 Subunit of succinate dehydrogenase, which couples succinate oxidation to ubiquinone reduction [Maudiozyma saulgeensis]|uniref:Succinate dehydrogenase assembly factor 2, mitochondrial n=1 Tax=Maudiozyma saulgeensis TaxID=1789683 RepID=A0A1X7RB63_9SACH|nr:similar to Saccharomyces cerevisiae YOL071W EMI5 Subunit of succinate dehydrogenase, which couples succinate oxidation to ubiquinone reduction [Kazachstania saulgeensis]
MLLRVGSRVIPKRTNLVIFQAGRLYSSNPKGNIHDSELKDIISRIKIAPNKRVGESDDKMKSRLVYQSRKRGILETDLLLSAFAAKYLKTMTRKQLEEYDNLLYELDWDIYYWATKDFQQSPIPDRWKDSEIMKLLQAFTENKEKKIIRMPELDKF